MATATKLQFRFDPNQDYQLEAIRAVTELFDGVSAQVTAPALGYEIIPNLPLSVDLSERLLKANLDAVQARHRVRTHAQSPGLQPAPLGAATIFATERLQRIGRLFPRAFARVANSHWSRLASY